MKKSLSFLACLLASSFANAQYVTEESYLVYQEPYVERSYGNANWSYVTAPQLYPKTGYENIYIQENSYDGYSQNQTAIQWDEFSETSSSPVFKKFYITLRAGMGETLGWDKNEKAGKVDDPIGAILSLSLGGHLNKNLRVDGEFAYHTKDTLYHGKDIYLKGEGKYSQYDFGLNTYYDFTSSKLKPFLGIGIWGITSKITSNISNTYGDTRDTSRSKTNFAISGAVGIAYQINELISLEAMGRARYIFDEDIYNLEGLIGTRFSF